MCTSTTLNFLPSLWSSKRVWTPQAVRVYRETSQSLKRQKLNYASLCILPPDEKHTMYYSVRYPVVVVFVHAADNLTRGLLIGGQ